MRAYTWQRWLLFYIEFPLVLQAIVGLSPICTLLLLLSCVWLHLKLPTLVLHQHNQTVVDVSLPCVLVSLAQLTEKLKILVNLPKNPTPATNINSVSDSTPQTQHTHEGREGAAANDFLQNNLPDFSQIITSTCVYTNYTLVRQLQPLCICLAINM